MKGGEENEQSSIVNPTACGHDHNAEASAITIWMRYRGNRETKGGINIQLLREFHRQLLSLLLWGGFHQWQPSERLSFSVMRFGLVWFAIV